MGLRTFLIKIISMIDYFNNKDEMETQSQIKYSNMHYNNNSYSHTPEYYEENDSEIYIFDSLQKFVEFKEDVTGYFPKEKDIARHRIMSTSITNGNDGNNYIVVTTLQCFCTYCTARSTMNKYSEYNIKHYSNIERLGFKTIDYTARY